MLPDLKCYTHMYIYVCSHILLHIYCYTSIYTYVYIYILLLFIHTIVFLNNKIKLIYIYIYIQICILSSYLSLLKNRNCPQTQFLTLLVFSNGRNDQESVLNITSIDLFGNRYFNRFQPNYTSIKKFFHPSYFTFRNYYLS